MHASKRAPSLHSIELAWYASKRSGSSREGSPAGAIEVSGGGIDRLESNSSWGSYDGIGM